MPSHPSKHHPESAHAYIVGLGLHTPPKRPQEDAVAAQAADFQKMARRIAKSGGIDTRGTSVPLRWLREATSGDLAAHHDHAGPQMGIEALRQATDAPQKLDAVVCVNSTGFSFPGMAETLFSEYNVGRTDSLRLNITGHGCVGAIPALHTASALIQSGQVETAAVVCSEPNMALYNPNAACATSTVCNMIFGEAAGAITLSSKRGDHTGPVPAIVGHYTQTFENTADAVTVRGGEYRQTRLSTELPNLAAQAAPKVIDGLLSQEGLLRSDINLWAFHTGGKKILDSFEQSLGLTPEQMEPSRTVLRENGNVQSPSVLFSFAQAQQVSPPNVGDYGVMLAVGPGITMGAILVRWF